MRYSKLPLPAFVALAMLVLPRSAMSQDQEVRDSWPNGNLRLHGWVKEGQRHGKWEWYDESGQIENACTYAGDVLKGEYAEYYPSGGPKVVCTYHAGKRQGRYKGYYASGELLADIVYEEDAPREYRHFYRDGVPMSEAACKLMLEVWNSEVPRDRLRAYLDLAREHVARGYKQDAEELLERGLKRDPGDCEGQFTLAQLETERRDFVSAGIRLRFVREHSKDPALIRAADELLASPFIRNTVVLTHQPPLLNRVLHVLPIADADMRLVQAVVERLRSDFGVRVQTLEPFDLAETTVQESQLGYLQPAVAGILYDMTPENAAELFTRAGVKPTEVLSNEKLRAIVKAFMEGQADGLRGWSDIAARLESQLDAEVVAAQVAERYPRLLSSPEGLGVLAITGRDLRVNNSVFVFGKVDFDLHVGVMSYDRFRRGNPSLEVLVKRTVMQSFSSAGFLIGIDRCTTPTCARAYPNNLREHDRKNDTMCPRCGSRIREVHARLSTPSVRPSSQDSKRSPGK